MQLISRQNLKRASKALDEGHILGVPTETTYGLAVSLKNRKAIEKLMDIKERPISSDKIFTLMVSNVEEISKFAKLNKQEKYIANRFFPGELTMILDKHDSLNHFYFNQADSIGIRIPKHDFMLKLLQKTGPLLVTSANPRGEAPCFSAADLQKRMPMINYAIDEESGRNLPSTILDLRSGEPKIIRQGGLLIVHYK